jgi:hypothetical protein
MIAGFVLALVALAPGVMSIADLESRPVPEVWAYVQSLRSGRDRDMIRHGREGEENTLRRGRAERILIGRVRSGPVKLRPGDWLIHAPEAGRGHLEEWHLPD